MVNFHDDLAKIWKQFAKLIRCEGLIATVMEYITHTPYFVYIRE